MKRFIYYAIMAITISACAKREVRETKNPLTGQLMEQYEVVENKEGSFLNDGFYKTWHTNGQIEISGQYKKNKRTGKWTAYYANGQVKKINNFENDSLNGEFIEYYENGTKKVEVNFIKNEYSGNLKKWFDNGKIAESGYYENGLLNGLHEIFFPDGQKYSEINFKNGLREGKATYWLTDGKKDVEGQFTNDKKNGIWILYDENGKVKREIDFANDVPKIAIGKWIDNRNKITVEFKENGEVQYFKSDKGSFFGMKYDNSIDETYILEVNLYDFDFWDTERAFKNPRKSYSIETLTDKEIILKSSSSLYGPSLNLTRL
ncbi:MAG TPA: toxin-antitoxin system YwqK family antitoxin [Tenuifilaceae bacterium]|nr:toxin-antitoxin system YwqK family antitoxin [Tenuifilaceae bacterium]